MVPKIEMVTININDKESELLNRIIDTGHSRYPVLGNESNEVLDFCLQKDILPIMKNKTKNKPFKHITRCQGCTGK